MTPKLMRSCLVAKSSHGIIAGRVISLFVLNICRCQGVEKLGQSSFRKEK